MDIAEVTAFLNTDEGKALVETHEATNGLRTKKDELLSSNTVLKTQLEAYKALGDPQTLAAAIAAAKEAATKTPEVTQPAQPTVDPKLTAQLEHLQKELETERGTRTKREQALVNSFVSGEVTTAITAAKGEPLLLKPIVAQRVKGTLNEDGSIGIEVMNADGSPMFKNGKPATVNDLMVEIKADKAYGRAFDPDEASGSGTRTAAQGKAKQSTEGLTLTELMAKQKKKA